MPFRRGVSATRHPKASDLGVRAGLSESGMSIILAASDTHPERQEATNGRRRQLGIFCFLAALILLLDVSGPLQAQVLGNIQTVAGQCTGTGYVQEPTQATVNKLGNKPIEIAVDAAGNLYISDSANNRVRMVD